jgi:hypothetical protein
VQVVQKRLGCANPAHKDAVATEYQRLMGQLTIVYWRDIPSQVIARSGRANEKRMLPDRFQEAIDMAAMRDGASGSDAYLADWRRTDAVPCGEDLAAEAERAAAELDANFGKDRLKALIGNGGREPA